MTSRIFISLDIPDKNLDELISQRDQIYGLPNNVRWESKDKLHITLKFLGDVGENILELLIRRLEDIQFKKINSKFDKFSFFKKNGALKILFAGFHKNSNIHEFQDLIEKESELLGFKKEFRKFHSHLTLLRMKGKEDISRFAVFNNHDIVGEDFIIDSFSIIKSELKPNGSEYTILKSFNLR